MISDLHSNREALEAVFAHIRESGNRHDAVLLGRHRGLRPRARVLRRPGARSLEAVTLMGNHDEALFQRCLGLQPARSHRDRVHAAQRMAPTLVFVERDARPAGSWLRDLPLVHKEGRFTLVHGSPRDPVREYVLSTDGFLNPSTSCASIFDSFDGIAVGGHTHHPGMHDRRAALSGARGLPTSSRPCRCPKVSKFFVNVGSTGQPRDGDNRACYAVLEDEPRHLVPRALRLPGARWRRSATTGTLLSEILARRLADRQVERRGPQSRLNVIPPSRA